MWFPKSISWWMKQNTASRKLQANRRRRSAGSIERLEDRTLLSVTASLVGTTVTFTGDGASDYLALQVNAAGQIEYSVNFGATTNDLDGGAGTQTLLMSAASQVIVNMGSGQDDLIVLNNGAGGFFGNAVSGFRIQYDGGADGDAMSLVGGTATSEEYTPGPNPGQGTFSTVSAARSQLVQFSNLDPLNTLGSISIYDDVTGPLTINAGDAANAINYSTSPFGATFGAVTVDNFETVNFTNKTTLTLNGEAGDDSFNLDKPATTPTGLTSIVVNGGDPTASDTLVVNGTAGSLDNLRYVPTNLGAGTVVVDSGPGPDVNFTGVEHLQLVVQQADGDGVRFDGTTGDDNIEFTQGSTAGSGTFSGTMDTNNATGVGPFAMTPVTFFNANPLGNDIDLNFFNPGGTDSLVFNGTAADDTIQVAFGEAGGTEIRNTINGEIVARIEAFNIASAIVRGGDGDDTFNHSGNITVPVSYEGGDPSASDTLNFNGSGNGIAVDFATQTVQEGGFGLVTISGIENLNVNGLEGVADAFTVSNYGATTGVVQLTLNAADSGGVDEADRIDINTAPQQGDTLQYTPLTRFTSTLTRAEGGPQINIAGFRGHNDVSALSVAGGAGGEDRMEVYGVNSPTAFVVSRTSASQTLVETTLSAGTGNDEPGIPIDFANIESLELYGSGGNDSLLVSEGAGGLVDLASGVTFHGGSGIDSLSLTGATVRTATYLVGPNADEGTITHVAAGITQRVTFTGLEPIFDSAAGTLEINATNAANSVNYRTGFSTLANFLANTPSATWGEVTVDGFEAYEFLNKTTLTINAGAGDDTINLNNPNAPTGLTSIIVNGGDPTASDTLLIVGTSGTDTVVFTPTGISSGSLTGLAAPDHVRDHRARDLRRQ